MRNFNWLLLFTGLWLVPYAGMACSNNVKPIFHDADTTASKKVVSTAKTKHIKFINQPDTAHNPMLALKRSAFIPGLGQLYNRKWWKVPVIYTGLGLLGSAYIYNQRYYKQYLTVYHYYRQNPATISSNSAHYALYKQLRSRTNNAEVVGNYANGFQRNMQLSILGFAGAWGVQMLDAFVDAKFIHSYSMSRNLAINISPAIITGTGFNYSFPNPVMAPALRFRLNM